MRLVTFHRVDRDMTARDILDTKTLQNIYTRDFKPTFVRPLKPVISATEGTFAIPFAETSSSRR
jgi:hypothetical protein